MNHMHPYTMNSVPVRSSLQPTQPLPAVARLWGSRSEQLGLKMANGSSWVLGRKMQNRWHMMCHRWPATTRDLGEDKNTQVL